MPPGLLIAALAGFTQGYVEVFAQIALSIRGGEADFCPALILKFLAIGQVFFEQGKQNGIGLTSFHPAFVFIQYGSYFCFLR